MYIFSLTSKNIRFSPIILPISVYKYFIIRILSLFAFILFTFSHYSLWFFPFFFVFSTNTYVSEAQYTEDNSTMASSNMINDDYAIICDRLFALKSWKYEEKSSLLHMIVNWRSLYEKSEPTKLETNLRHLRVLLTERLIIQPMLPVETILKVIGSDNIPSDAWLDCLLAAIRSNMNDSNNTTSISFDFAPVIMPKVDFNRQTSDSVSNRQRSYLRDQSQRYFILFY